MDGFNRPLVQTSKCAYNSNIVGKAIDTDVELEYYFALDTSGTSLF
jgi:hypothetical protein